MPERIRRCLISIPSTGWCFDKAVEETRIKPLLANWFSQYTREELEQMAGTRIPINAVKTVAEVVHDPHIRSRNMIVRVPMGSQQIEMFGSPIKLSSITEAKYRAAPMQGEHSEMLLATIGLEQNTIDELRIKGVI
ncbi:CoA transferase [Pectobacterium brasiliense]|nr:CoA transferase [Pectobacterium brasiliense]